MNRVYIHINGSGGFNRRQVAIGGATTDRRQNVDIRINYYDGKTLPTGQAGFKNFTTRDGLVNNEITSIYEDNTGNIWFGVNGGVSRYDGTSFRNFIMNGDFIIEDTTRKTVPDFTRPPNEVTSIVENKTGKFWFATRGNTFVYDARLPDG